MDFEASLECDHNQSSDNILGNNHSFVSSYVTDVCVAYVALTQFDSISNMSNESMATITRCNGSGVIYESYADANCTVPISGPLQSVYYEFGCLLDHSTHYPTLTVTGPPYLNGYACVDMTGFSDHCDFQLFGDISGM